MDPITHILAGTAIGLSANSLYSNKTINNKVLLFSSIIGSIIPDVDVLFRFILPNTLDSLFLHRYFTHSFFFAPINAFISILPFIKKITNIESCVFIYIITIISVITHIILDLFTSYGTVVFWPFSEKRYALDLLTIINLPFTFILFIYCYFVYKHKSVLSKLTLSLLVLWLFVETLGQIKAYSLQTKLINHRNHSNQVMHRRIIPKLGKFFTWHSIYIIENKIYCDSIILDLLGNGTIITGETTNRLNIQEIRNLNLSDKTIKRIVKFEWFSDGFVGFQKMSDNEYLLSDLRYTKVPGKILPFWGLRLKDDGLLEFVRINKIL